MGEYVLVRWKIQRVEMENNCGSQSQGNAQSNDYNRRHFFLIAGRMANDRHCRSDDCIRYCVSSFNSSGIWHRYCNSCVEFSSLHKMCARQHFKSSEFPLKHNFFHILQVQAVMNGKEKFGTVRDCVGFTSAPIWAGVLVSLFIAFVVAIGIIMIMDIKPPNRFESSRGKQLTFTIQE